MDGITEPATKPAFPTEPVLVVLGDPIAGNPSQFALERAFAAVNAEWRVVSRSIAPADLATAIAGLKVCDFGGVWLDHHLARQDDGIFGLDCFSPSDRWQGMAIRQQFAGTKPAPLSADPFEFTESSEIVEASDIAEPDEIAEPASQLSPWLAVEVSAIAALVKHLVGRTVPDEMLLDAIEEYQSV